MHRQAPDCIAWTGYYSAPQSLKAKAEKIQLSSQNKLSAAQDDGTIVFVAKRKTYKDKPDRSPWMKSDLYFKILVREKSIECWEDIKCTIPRDTNMDSDLFRIFIKEVDLQRGDQIEITPVQSRRDDGSQTGLQKWLLKFKDVAECNRRFPELRALCHTGEQESWWDDPYKRNAGICAGLGLGAAAIAGYLPNPFSQPDESTVSRISNSLKRSYLPTNTADQAALGVLAAAGLWYHRDAIKNFARAKLGCCHEEYIDW